MLARPESPAPDPQVLRFQFDQRVTAHYFQARIMWLQGFADQARHVVEANLLEAEPAGNALSLASVLGQGACMVALFSGDLPAAEGYGARLLDHAVRHGLGLWEGWARGFNAAVSIRQGDIEGGLAGLRRELAAAAEARFLPRYLVLIAELAAGLGAAGEGDLGLQTVDEAIARCEANGKLWYLAELLRIKGDLVRQNRGDEAEALFRRAQDTADGQGALSWSLRAAVSLARLRPDPATVNQLQAVYGRFSEGFDTADLLTARRILDG
jgi:predicted ATPase